MKTGKLSEWHVTCPRVLANMIDKDKLEVRKCPKIQVRDFDLVVAPPTYLEEEIINPENSQKLILSVSYKIFYAAKSCP